MAEGDEGHESQEGTKNGQITIDDRTFKAEDVQNLLDQQASATEKTQQVAPILSLAERYNLEPQQLAENFEGMAGVFNDLIDKGLIDEQGNVLKPAVKQTKEPEQKVLETKKTEQGPVTKGDEVAMKALVSPIMDKLQKLEEDNTMLMKLRLQDQIQTKFDNIEEGDVATVFALAERDRTKSIMQHAEDISKQKVAEREKLEAEFAKKHNIDLEEAKQRMLFEQDPSGGAAALVAKKKISFKKGKDAVTPRQATADFFKRVGLD
jgi:hypothetical protein